MKRRMADVLVAGIAGLVLLLGAIWSFQVAQQPTMMDGSMMDGSMGTYGTDPLLYLLGGVVLAVVIAGGYLVVRDQLAEPTGSEGTPPSGVPVEEPMTETAPVQPESASVGNSERAETDAEGSANPESSPSTERELLRYLPEDERRVLEPVLDSPGVTQIEIRDRSDFSKSKVSQTLSELEKRGLIYKEKQGRTFRVYPGEELGNAESS